MTSIKVNQELQAQLVIKQQILTYKQLCRSCAVVQRTFSKPQSYNELVRTPYPRIMQIVIRSRSISNFKMAAILVRGVISTSSLLHLISIGKFFKMRGHSIGAYV